MSEDQIEVRKRLFVKSLRAFQKTASELQRFDQLNTYNDLELEKYDALGARFTRVYECAIKLFRAKDIVDSLETAVSYRDLLHKMERFGWISDIEIWNDIKIVRNKLNHEYLPSEQESIYNFIIDI